MQIMFKVLCGLMFSFCLLASAIPEDGGHDENKHRFNDVILSTTYIMEGNNVVLATSNSVIKYVWNQVSYGAPLPFNLQVDAKKEEFEDIWCTSPWFVRVRLYAFAKHIAQEVRKKKERGLRGMAATCFHPSVFKSKTLHDFFMNMPNKKFPYITGTLLGDKGLLDEDIAGSTVQVVAHTFLLPRLSLEEYITQAQGKCVSAPHSMCAISVQDISIGEYVWARLYEGVCFGATDFFSSHFARERFFKRWGEATWFMRYRTYSFAEYINYHRGVISEDAFSSGLAKFRREVSHLARKVKISITSDDYDCTEKNVSGETTEVVGHMLLATDREFLAYGKIFEESVSAESLPGSDRARPSEEIRREREAMRVSGEVIRDHPMPLGDPGDNDDLGLAMAIAASVGLGEEAAIRRPYYDAAEAEVHPGYNDPGEPRDPDLEMAILDSIRMSVVEQEERVKKAQKRECSFSESIMHKRKSQLPLNSAVLSIWESAAAAPVTMCEDRDITTISELISNSAELCKTMDDLLMQLS